MKFLVLTLAITITSSYGTPSINAPQDDTIHVVAIDGGKKGNGTTTRYWDCCKPSCAWTENSNIDPPVASCKIDGVTIIDNEIESGCLSDGSAYTCSNQQPVVVNDTLSLGFVAASFVGGLDYSFCCACVLLSFRGELEGKQLLAQVVDAGETLSVNQFDIVIPGGGVGSYNEGCTRQWGAPSNGWGRRYGGVTSETQCSELPPVLQEGCKYRFQWMNGVSNPDVSFVEVQCPKRLTDISGCQRKYTTAAPLKPTPAEDVVHAVPVDGGAKGNGTTTRYWDCCKPSCAWIGNAEINPPVTTCQIDGVTPIDKDIESGCLSSGNAYACNNQQPIIVNETFALGFVGASFTGGLDFSFCCSCVLLSFKGELEGKQLLAQVTNAGDTFAVNQFNIAIPGGGVGPYNKGCRRQWGASTNGWGTRYGGVTYEAQCSDLPGVLQEGCKFRFEWMSGESNPDVSFVEVQCPKRLTDISGCQRKYTTK